MKGQYLTIEQMVLFTIGVAITIVVFYSFSSIQDHVQTQTIKDQALEVGNLILTGLTEAALSTNKNSIKIIIPTEIAGGEYKIVIRDGNLLVGLMNGDRMELSLEGLNESFDMYGHVSSGKGKIVIERDGDLIWLR
jgi:hypothetical protein